VQSCIAAVLQCVSPGGGIIREDNSVWQRENFTQIKPFLTFSSDLALPADSNMTISCSAVKRRELRVINGGNWDTTALDEEASDIDSSFPSRVVQRPASN
jgi:hypothetical protein